MYRFLWAAPLFLGLFLIAVPAQAVFYAPGETLDPSCAPTDPSCGISNPVDTGTTGQIPFYADNGAMLSATSTLSILSNGSTEISGPLSVMGIKLVGSSATSDNFLVNATDNAIESGTIVNTIGGGGRDGLRNLIGFGTKPTGTDYTPTDWADDTGYVAGTASVGTISGGYDHVNNQIAGTISGGGHNFIKYNSVGHSFIGGGSYNLISGGRSVIIGGQRNTITGANSIGSGISAGINNNIIGSYSSIGGGLDNSITGDYSFIAGGRLNTVNGDWAFAFGRRAQANATGTVAFADSTNADFTVGTQNIFASRFSGGYWLTGGNVGIGTTSPNGKLSVYGGSAGAYTPSTNGDLAVLEGSGSDGLTIVTPDASTGNIFFGSPSRQIGGQISWRHSTGIFSLGSGNGGAQVQILSGNSVEAVRINSSGNVGVASTSPWRKFTVAGTVGFDGLTAAVGAGSLCLSANKEVVYNSGTDNCLSSTRDTKHDIEPLSLSNLEMVYALEPVSFVYNNDAEERKRYGFIAEDAADVDEHLITKNTEGKISGLDTPGFLALIVGAIQDMANSFTTKFLKTDTLCVGSTCITEAELQELLEDSDQHNTYIPPSAPQNPEPPVNDEPITDEPVVDEPIVEEPAPESEPEPEEPADEPEAPLEQAPAE